MTHITLNIPQYLITLTAYACIAILIFMAATKFSGWLGLFGALSAVLLVCTISFFVMRRPIASGTPLAETIITIVAAIVVAGIVWLRRSRTGFDRIKTLIVSLLAFHAAWLGAGFALQNWH